MTDIARAVHPISVVTRRTGLSQDLLRAWEKRYEAVSPWRTTTGRRLYSDVDVQRLRLMKRLVDGGRRISDVARLPIEELDAMATEDAAETVRTESPSSPARGGGSVLDACFTAIERLDRGALEDALAEAAAALPAPRLRREVLVPLIIELGDRWESGAWRIAQEHLGTMVVRGFLWDLVRRATAADAGAAVVVATLSGHRHELGALLAALVAAEQGWNVVYLGPDLPAEEVAAAAVASGARAVILSLVFPRGDAATAAQLQRLRALLASEVAILAGGRAAPSYQAVLAASGSTVVGDLDALQDYLRRAPR